MPMRPRWRCLVVFAIYTPVDVEAKYCHASPLLSNISRRRNLVSAYITRYFAFERLCVPSSNSIERQLWSRLPPSRLIFSALPPFQKFLVEFLSLSIGRWWRVRLFRTEASNFRLRFVSLNQPLLRWLGP